LNTIAETQGGRTLVELYEVERMALNLPETKAGFSDNGQFFAEVAGKGFAWTWMERVAPKKPRVPCLDALAVRVKNLDEKDMLLSSDERLFFTEPHYNGFPAVLVRLHEIAPQDLHDLLLEGWRTRAPKRLIKESGL
jgi:hypothetical protein